MKDSYGCEKFCEYCHKPFYSIKYLDGGREGMIICNQCKKVYPNTEEAKKYVGK